ncbi:MAG: hypothetical protein WCG90_06075 [Chitinophagia bacterium]
MKNIKIVFKKISILAFASSLFFLAGCSKGGDSPAPTPTPPPVVITESDLVFKVDIAGSEVNYASVYAVVGTSVLMNPTISSTLPKDGVTIDVSVKKKLDNTVVFSSNLSSSASSNPVTVTGLAPGVLCVATITITSKSKASNTATKTFELAAK